MVSIGIFNICFCVFCCCLLFSLVWSSNPHLWLLYYKFFKIHVEILRICIIFQMVGVIVNTKYCLLHSLRSTIFKYGNLLELYEWWSAALHSIWMSLSQWRVWAFQAFHGSLSDSFSHIQLMTISNRRKGALLLSSNSHSPLILHSVPAIHVSINCWLGRKKTDPIKFAPTVFSNRLQFKLFYGIILDIPSN